MQLKLSKLQNNSACFKNSFSNIPCKNSNAFFPLKLKYLMLPESDEE